MTRRTFFALPFLLLSTLAMAATMPEPTPPEPDDPPAASGVRYASTPVRCGFIDPAGICCEGAIAGLPEASSVVKVHAAYTCGGTTTGTLMGETAPLMPTPQGLMIEEVCTKPASQPCASGDPNLGWLVHLRVLQGTTVVYEGAGNLLEWTWPTTQAPTVPEPPEER